jgi:hypothetical protein
VNGGEACVFEDGGGLAAAVSAAAVEDDGFVFGFEGGEVLGEELEGDVDGVGEVAVGELGGGAHVDEARAVADELAGVGAGEAVAAAAAKEHRKPRTSKTAMAMPILRVVSTVGAFVL